MHVCVCKIIIEIEGVPEGKRECESNNEQLS